MQSKSIHVLLSQVQEESRKHSPAFIPLADGIYAKFKGAFEKFGACHRVYNGNVVTPDVIKQLGKSRNSVDPCN